MNNNISIIKLTKQFLEDNIDFFINLGKDIIPRELQYWDKSHYLCELEGKWDYSLYCMKNNTIVGFIICTKKSEKNFVHINKMAIKKEFRSLRIGAKMITNLKQECINNKIAAISLYTNKINNKALSFYLTNGFQVENIIIDETTSKYYMIQRLKY